MSRKLAEIPPERFDARIFNLFANEWFLLAAGDFSSRSFNAMTIAWGSLGVMWSKPFAMVVLRKQRYTLKFMETCDSFTLCAFPPEFKRALSICGSKSGRDGDKIAEAGLTPTASTKVAAPSFGEAELVLECKKSYFGGMLNPQGFVDPNVLKTVYPENDLHIMFWGEVVAIRGVEKHLCKDKTEK